MKPIPKLLSKTKIMRGYRCLKYIYLTIQQPELETPITPDTQALFDQGHLVGSEARKYFPGGKLIDNKPWDFGGALSATREAIANGVQTIYEAAFEYMGCYARADIIQLNPDTHRWRIYEVKSSTKVKPEQIDDVGLQTWIMAKSGLPIEQIHIMHLNGECRYPDLSNLFTIENVTDTLRETYLSIQPKVHQIMTTLREPEAPNIDIGSYCLEPTECTFKAHCWRHIPEMSIFNLPNMRNRKWELYRDGIIELNDPRLTDLSDIQQRIVKTYQTGTRYLDKDGITSALSEWTFPLVFLDFESINPAIPRYTGTKPFQQVPFQFSVHLWPSPDSTLIHHAFLHDTPDDPRPALIPALLDACGNEGSIVAYYKKFETDRINELADYAPAYRDALNQLVERMVDPLPIIRANIYDNAFGGSFSLKRVAPALLGAEHSYKDMTIGDGAAAQRAFEELISPHTPSGKKSRLREAMLEYCEKDTYVMVELIKWLFNLVES